MESTIVIKVKYGEMLRRFIAHVDENGRLSLGINGIREKVINLFNFAPDVDLMLTYIDEDCDVVTLVDEEDLHDVIRQSLNPLRITVKLNSDKGARSYARSSGSSTPMISPRVQNPLSTLNTGVSEILKSVPEPFREALSKLSADIAFKAASSAPGFAEIIEQFSKMGQSNLAASSAPVLAEIIEQFSKMGQSNLNTVSEFQVGSVSSPHGDASGRTMEASASKYPMAKMDEKATPDVLPNSKPEESASKINENMNSAKVNSVIRASVSDVPAYGLVNLNASFPGDSFLSGYSTPVSVDVNEDKIEKSEKSHLIGKSVGSTSGNITLEPKVLDAGNSVDMKDSNESHIGRKSVGAGASARTGGYLYYPESQKTNAGISNQFPSNLGIPSASHFGVNPYNECPFTGMPLANDLAATCARVHPFKRSYYYKNSDGIGSIFHRGVQCDGCGVHPIIGPRFKSKVKEDFDLCSICFSQMGNEADYTRMDRPASHHYPWFSQAGVRPPIIPQVLRGSMKSYRPKLDGRFIRDVNIMDGTVMAPSTPFTKIWRMQNNGTMVWAEGTRLVWIGGDKLSDTASVKIEIPSDGLPVDNELDIAVNFTSPELPGRYISYWRMASPSRQKFGQRVWVLIQVDAAMKDTTSTSFHGFNLNLPPDSNDMTSPEIVDSSVELMEEGGILEPDNSNAIEPVEPIVEEHPNKDQDQELNFPINDSLLVGDGVSNAFPVKPSSPVSYPIIDSNGVSIAFPVKPSAPVSYPIIDLSEVAPTVTTQAPSPVTNEPSSDEVHNDVEQALLTELEEMGFKEVDLNKEILRRNEYDLERSVDDLCSDLSEWDPILDELQEMGFTDNEMNKRLLKKNNGSIKRVVMDLIIGEKDES